MSSYVLKWIAIITMTIDHLAGLFDGNTYLIMRIIGRISFPIFAFLIAEGYYHTRNKKKYIGRLFLFALISQVPYALMFDGPLNILFNYAFSLVLLYIIETSKDPLINISFTIVTFILCFLCDWSIFAPLSIIILYFFREKKIKYLFFALVLILHGARTLYLDHHIISFFTLLSIPLIGLYNMQKGKSMKYFFYIYYPLHLIIIYIIQTHFK